jgi:hypothetical protein
MSAKSLTEKATVERGQFGIWCLLTLSQAVRGTPLRSFVSFVVKGFLCPTVLRGEILILSCRMEWIERGGEASALDFQLPNYQITQLPNLPRPFPRLGILPAHIRRMVHQHQQAFAAIQKAAAKKICPDKSDQGTQNNIHHAEPNLALPCHHVRA